MGLNVSRTARVGPAGSLVLAVATTAVVTLISRRYDAGTAIRAATPAIGLVALLLGAWQWRRVRHESAIDKFYDRLHTANEMRLAAVDCTKDRWILEDFYVFTEMDNLEYAIHKYKDGFMSRSMTNRALTTFENRCDNIRGFRDLVRKYHNEGYSDEARHVIKELARLDKIAPESAPPSEPGPVARTDQIDLTSRRAVRTGG